MGLIGEEYLGSAPYRLLSQGGVRRHEGLPFLLIRLQQPLLGTLEGKSQALQPVQATPPNRDTVSESYLKQVYTIVLNTMQAEQFADAWVKSAVESNRIEPDAVKKTINERYGDKVVTWSSVTDANMRALDSGFQVLHPRTMSKPELDNMRRLGELKGAKELFGQDPDMGPPIDVSNDPAKQEFAKWARYLGVLVNKAVTIEFVRDDGKKHKFSCTANTDAPIITFNVAKFPQEFFAARGKDQTELMIHELAHAFTDAAMSHGPKWGEACAHVGAILSNAPLRNPNHVPHL